MGIWERRFFIVPPHVSGRLSIMAGEKKTPSKDRDRDNDAPDLASTIQQMLSKFGTSEAAMTQLLSDNFKLREKNRDLKRDLEEAEQQVPAEGSVVLTKAEGERWTAYTALGKPEDVKKTIEEHGTLKTKVADAERMEQIRAASQVEGMSSSVLGQLAKAEHVFEIVTVKGDDNVEKKVANVVVTIGDKKETHTLKAYAESHWKDFLPSLYVGDQTTNQQQSDQPPPKGDGTKFVKQSGTQSQQIGSKEELVKHERSALLNTGNYRL
jgi:hypothetical protein